MLETVWAAATPRLPSLGQNFSSRPCVWALLYSTVLYRVHVPVCVPAPPGVFLPVCVPAPPGVFLPVQYKDKLREHARSHTIFPCFQPDCPVG